MSRFGRLTERLGEGLMAAWYGDAAWLGLLRPLEALYRRQVTRRLVDFQSGKGSVHHPGVPVIVVGNLTLGGTGKSPLVAWLARHLAEQGYRPGILSRGYGGESEEYPLRVSEATPVEACGDEPLMLAAQTGVPVVVDPRRARGAERLLDEGCDILISDDGLQHLALGRDLELVVVDGQRGFGNGRCLPAGPLREPLSRLESVDALVVNGAEPDEVAGAEGAGQRFTMTLKPVGWRRLTDDARLPLSPLPFARAVHGLAGIGNPPRFFATLEGLGLRVTPHPKPDHHRFTPEDLRFDDEAPVVMTAKDAVKCRGFADARCWALDVEAHPSAGFIEWFATQLDALTRVAQGEDNDG
ncbi:tetraacyldisaccharide 4'-kinase [Halomonas sp. YLGW01]|uniref:tetraacyldisaccharide 4'-kinase n=1 Tax=Halomonas sp. YLGW01 TaxID=2773308 RepID=UPI0032426F47